MFPILTRGPLLYFRAYLAAVLKTAKIIPEANVQSGKRGVMQTYLKTRPVWVQLLLFLGMAFGLLAILGAIGMMILSGMTGISLEQLKDIDKMDPGDPNVIFFIRGSLLLQFLGLFLIPSLLFAYFSDPQPAQYLRLQPPKKNRYWILAVAVMFVSIPLVEYLGLLNQKLSLGTTTDKWMKGMEEEAMKQIQFMLHIHTPAELLKNLVFISLFAGIGEELFFRGILQRLFIRAFKSPWAGIIVTALIFSAFHLQFYGFFPRFLLGMLLGVIYWYSGSIFTAMAAHFIYDGFIIVLAYFVPAFITNPDKPMINAASLIPLALFSTALTGLGVWLMKKYSDTSYESIYKNDRPPDPFSF
jgi:uncharacterized protein